MKIDVKLEDLQKKKLFIGTPMYGGMCSGTYCKSSNEMVSALTKYGITSKTYYIFNESLITRARNYIADEFLRSDCTHLLFIDADIGFSYKDVFMLLNLCEEDEYSVIGGPYPKKTIAWEKVAAAAFNNGYGKENPFDLAEFTSDFVFNPEKKSDTYSLTEPISVKETGTGFMMIHRKVFEKYLDQYPQMRYIPDHTRSRHYDGSKEITCFFDTIIDPVSRRYLSEDYMFCHNVKKMGIQVWLCPWMNLTHFGSYTFSGNMASLAKINAAPTTTKESNPKHYLKKGNL